MIYLCLLTIPFLAFAYRARGGAIPLGSTLLARLVFWVLPIGSVVSIIAAANHSPVWVPILSTLLTFAGICLGHSAYQGNTIKQNLEMAAITTFRLFIILLPFAYYNHILILLSFLGLLGGLSYYLGWRTPDTLKIGSITWCIPNSTEWAELYTGGLAFGLPLAILAIMS